MDALISLYRMPASFEFAIAEISQRFRGVSEEPLELILRKFCTISVQEPNDDWRRASKFASAKDRSEAQFKLTKSKEQIKTLILNIIGLVVHLQSNNAVKLSFLSQILKRESKELKNYCTELGLRLDPCKTKDRETGKEFDDLLARLKGARTHKSQPEQAEE